MVNLCNFAPWGVKADRETELRTSGGGKGNEEQKNR